MNEFITVILIAIFSWFSGYLFAKHQEKVRKQQKPQG